MALVKTDDIKVIMDTLRTDPRKVKYFDSTQFILAMTADKHGGLNPDSGIKFFEFNTVDKYRWAAYKAKENALFEKIKRDIKQEQQEILQQRHPYLAFMQRFVTNYKVVSL